MQYRQLGSSGLKVSEIGFGPWLTISRHLSIKKSTDIIHHAFSQGINFFDNAERYAEGMAEAVLGHVFKSLPREDLVVTTKIFWGGDGVNRTGLSRKHLVEGTKNSLHRLQLEYVDVLFCHRPDPNTPIEEVVVTMDMLIKQGHAFYWGTSEWPVESIIEACETAKRLGCIAPIVEQAEYNVFVRERVEQEYSTLYERYGMGVTVYSPLAFGLLTGKYRDGMADEFRLTHQERLLTADFEQRMTAANAFADLANENGIKPAQLALAWCLQKPYVNSVVTGASSADQLQENLKAVELRERIDADIFAQVDALYPSANLAINLENDNSDSKPA